MNLNREIWALLVGFPFDKREIHELANAVRSFEKFILWDRARSNKATLAVKIKVDELRDIPASIVVGESDAHNAESWIVPVVIIQHELLGGGPSDEDPVPVDGNPHPQSANPNFHPNQLNHFLGPIQQHQVEDANYHNQAMDLQEEPLEDDEDPELPGWGHWALPAEPVDQELHDGEFFELADLMQPLDIPDQVPADPLPEMDDHSDLTLSLGSNEIIANDQLDQDMEVEGNGFLNETGQHIFNGLPELILLLGL